ncbi:MAG TPA: beta-L-arabinofuranosidase domain-containing protein [Terracidiphilus sp.]|nr:beta-L-arabinofuranosidase domain-containing protein [Terracidiphilus sp.]
MDPTPDQHTAHPPALDRRQLLQLGLAGAALLLTHRSARAAKSAPMVATRGALTEFAPGAVEPQGWLGAYLARQAAELGTQLPDVSWPFSAEYWNGLEEAPSWWPWEQRAYWIDGATRLAIVMRDTALFQKTQVPILFTLQHAQPNGYLGPTFFENPVGDEHRWPQTVFFRSLMACADAGVGPAGIAEALQRHYLNDTADYALPERNVTNVEAMLWCYGQTGNTKLLSLAEDSWRRYLAQAAANPNHGDLGEARVYAGRPIHAHGVTYAETAKLPAILYLYTGDPEYLRFALAAQQRIFSHHMLVDGIPSTSEWFRTRTSLDSHETCDIVDHTWAWGYMLQATGDGLWGDRIERACFNAGPGAIRSDWKGLQYFSCPNQFVATEKSDHNVMEHGGYMMAYQPNPGRRTACCGGNVHRLYPNYVSRMWMRTANGGLAATLYGPSTLRANVGAARTPVEIVQTTDYPFRETVTLKFAGPHEAKFPLSLRIPAWCRHPKLNVNGRTITVTPRTGFVTLDRLFRPGDTLILTLPMELARTAWPYGGVALERGPLVFSLPIEDQWSTFTVSDYSTKTFPGYDAKTAGAWNYAVVLSSDTLENQVKVQQAGGELADDPWSRPPISLTVPARKVEDYRLQGNTNQEGQSFTPPLPDLAFAEVNAEIERITLVPYGSTQLRATIFPQVKPPVKE